MQSSSAETGVVMKGVDRQQTVETLQSLLQGLGLRYDFLYLPWDKKRNVNIGLAFVNFLNGSAECCIQQLGLLNTQQGGKLCRSIGKSHAHGLASNLAFFLVSVGVKALNSDHAPLVFDKLGQRMSLHSAIKQFVTMDLLIRTDEVWRRSRRGNQRGETTALLGVGPGRSRSSLELFGKGAPVDVRREPKNSGKLEIPFWESSDTAGTLGETKQKPQLVCFPQRLADPAVESWPLSKYHRPGRLGIPSQELPCSGKVEHFSQAPQAAAPSRQELRPVVPPQCLADLGMATPGPCSTFEAQHSHAFRNSRDLMESEPPSCSTSQAQCHGGSVHAEGSSLLSNHVLPAGGQQRENTNSMVKFTHIEVGEHKITIIDF